MLCHRQGSVNVNPEAFARITKCETNEEEAMQFTNTRIVSERERERERERETETERQRERGREREHVIYVTMFFPREDVLSAPKGGRGCLMSPSCLESQGIPHHCSISYVLVPTPIALSVLSSFPLMVHFTDFFPEFLNIFRQDTGFFFYSSYLVARRS